MAARDAVERFPLDPEILRAEIENRGAGRNLRTQREAAEPLDMHRSDSHDISFRRCMRRHDMAATHIIIRGRR